MFINNVEARRTPCFQINVLPARTAFSQRRADRVDVFTMFDFVGFGLARRKTDEKGDEKIRISRDRERKNEGRKIGLTLVCV